MIWRVEGLPKLNTNCDSFWNSLKNLKYIKFRTQSIETMNQET